MRARPLSIAVLAVLALGFGDGPHPLTAGVTYTWEVDDNSQSCLTPGAGASHTTIAGALATADPGENIFVCDGTYAEDNLQLMEDNVGMFGPGFTPEDDGTAVITRASVPASGQILYVRGDGTRVSGFEFDAAPVGSAEGVAIDLRANDVTISENVFMNSPFGAMYIDGVAADNFRALSLDLLRNGFMDNGTAFECFCDLALIQDNVVGGTSGEGMQVTGNANIITENELNGMRMTMVGAFSQATANTFDGTGQPMPFPLLTVSGDVLVSDNVFSNAGGLALRIYDGAQVEPTNAEVTLNLFTSVTKGIQISDTGPGDLFTVSALISGDQTQANEFVSSGGTLNDANYLLELEDLAGPINATFNNWGLCSLAAIEMEVYHEPDDSELGMVDYDPFVGPGSCPTPTPIPTPTASQTPTPEPTATPTATATAAPSPSATATVTPTPTASPGPEYTHGDNDCDGDIDPVDGLADLRHTAGLSPLAQHEPCPEIGAKFASIWGDMDCDEDVDAVDALAILRNVAELPALPQTEPCPDIGAPA